MKRICLAKILGPHGIKGLIKLRFFGEDPSLLESVPLFTSEKGEDTLTLSLKNTVKDVFLIQIEGINNPEEAKKLNGITLWTDRNNLPELSENDGYYIEDLIGLKAVDKDQKEIGKIIAVHNFGAGDLLEIRSITGEDFLLPFNDDHVPKIQKDCVIIANHDMMQP